MLTVDDDAIARAIPERISTAVWVFDIDNARVLWANPMGLSIWSATRMEELRQRDMKTDMSPGVASRLRQYQVDFEARDAVFTEMWTLYPRGVPCPMTIRFSGFRLDNGRMAMLCESKREAEREPEALRSADALLHTHLMISMHGMNGETLYMNPAARAAFADSQGALSQRFVDVRACDRLLNSVRARGETTRVVKVQTSAGVRWHKITARRCLDPVSGRNSILVSQTDVSRLKEAEALAKKTVIEGRRKSQAQARLLRMIDNMPVAVMTVDPKTFRINYVNETSKSLVRSIEHLVPVKAEVLVGASLDVFHRQPAYQRGILSDPANLPHHARINLGNEVLDLKVSAIIGNDGGYLGPMLTWALVTAEVEAERRIHSLAHIDALTGIPNRVTFCEELLRRLAQPDGRVGVLYIDLDGFKLINDTRGHPVGDALLCQVADRLRSVCHNPAIMIGRLGGDEFGMLLPPEELDTATKMATRIIEQLGAPYDFEHDKGLRIGASIGIALAPEHGETADVLLARADLALYGAKNDGKNQAWVFSPEMEARVQQSIRLEESLQDALRTWEELFVFYQPIVNIETGTVTAREALVRWHHPQMGWISPAQFVPIAEQSGLIHDLGDFVLETACREATRWEDGARVAVNISACELGLGALPGRILAVLALTGLPSNRLEIEVTETALLGDETNAIEELRRISSLGVHVALDDFGVGYSSLSHLTKFPFDKIKVDGSFVRNMGASSESSAAIVRTVAELGKRIGVITVAEGIETQAQLDRVRSKGCIEAQGYLIGRPAPSDADAARIGALDTASARGLA